MEDATRDLAPDLRRSAIDRLPKRGGLASTISSGMHVRAITFASFDVIRTEVDVSHKYDISGMDDTGIVIHPLFGNRGHWYLEHTHARGFISRVYNETVRKIDHGVHLDVDEIAAELDA
jgi:hypothetical protein